MPRNENICRHAGLEGQMQEDHKLLYATGGRSGRLVRTHFVLVEYK